MIIVDTNIIAYYILRTIETEKTIELRLKDNDWSAPALWRSEFRNMLLPYIRSGVLDLHLANEAVGKAKSIVRTRSVSSDRVIELAVASGCTAYDCEFVSLAERLSAPLVTNDRQVLRAFPGLAFSMHDFIDK